jgi:hypothetical protein
MPEESLPKPSLPTALVVVSWLFILFGISSLLEIISGLFHGRIEFNTGIIALFVGRGLLKLSRGWRTCALVLLWLSFILAPIFVLLLLNSPRPVNLNICGLPAGEAPPGVGLAVIALIFLLAIWQYRVLVGRDVRRLFGIPGS